MFDDFVGFFGGVDDLEEFKVCGIDIAVFKKVFLDPHEGVVPEFFANEDNRNSAHFVGLDEGKKFKKFVDGAVTTWEDTVGLCRNGEDHFSSEEVVETFAAFYVGVDALFTRELDVDTH